MFYVLLYNQNDRMMRREEIYVGVKKSNFEVAQTCFDTSEYHKVANIKHIVVYL